jgi:hypothetical protein
LSLDCDVARVGLFVVKFFSPHFRETCGGGGAYKIPETATPCPINPVARTSADYNIKPRQRESPRGFRPDTTRFNAGQARRVEAGSDGRARKFLPQTKRGRCL